MNQGFQQAGQAFAQGADQFGNAVNQGMQPYAGGGAMQGQPGQPGPGMPGMPMTAGGPPKQFMITLLLACGGAFGFFGLHRFYSGHIVLGLVQFFTLGGCGFWQMYDIYLIVTGKYTDSSGRPLAKS
jgi:hypothetical protein